MDGKKKDQLQMKGFSFFVHSVFTMLECNCTFLDSGQTETPRTAGVNLRRRVFTFTKIFVSLGVEVMGIWFCEVSVKGV